MNQHHSQQQPGWDGSHHPAGAPAPQPPKRRGVSKVIGLGCAGILGLILVVSVAATVMDGGSDSTDTGKKDRAVAAEEAKEEPAKGGPGEGAKSQAEEFRACVAESGTPTEKEAVKHVTKVTGADKRNDILDSAEVFTDFSGGLTGPHAGEGTLIASAFTSCYESENGLVTVYGKDGEPLATGNY
ncbi:hypothetical protein DIZ27_14260 [Streptomyces sp. NWU339]|uniref:hypothetical protein n=1 Tax=Streptomyces sp. NWU339 TaxID=2185284 RepID=UPI000D678380|nr:hypothetical protein [Streptomyces sp. NWU339]PWI09707.1 hypothetical protein DIZ27_14260 [Streptomyces sp. NWU339]